MKIRLLGLIMTVAACALMIGGTAFAADDAEKVGTVVMEKTEVTKEAASGPPIPFHTIEGYGGVLIVPVAYIINPAAEGEIFGAPSGAFIFLDIGKGRHLEVYAVSMALWDRVELSFAASRLDIDDLARDINNTFQTKLTSESHIWMYNFNARLNLLKEGEHDLPWLPAVTGGVHLKYNANINHLDGDTMGTLKSRGMDSNSGIEFTLTASKTITALPRPVILTAGMRASDAINTGFQGFTDNHRILFEGSIAVLILDNLIAAFEYRMKSASFRHLDPLLGKEDDWWTIDLAYIHDEHLTATVGYAHMGDVLNHRANGAWGFRVKYEF